MRTYNPTVFDQPDIDSAKSIILTPENGVTTSDRWNNETPYLCEKLLSWCSVGTASNVVDFGCGIGRMSRALIERTPANLWGIDISTSMRKQAVDYVESDRFATLSITGYEASIAGGMKWDMAISVWVLQHCPDLQKEVERLWASLKPNGLLFVVDMTHRAVPTFEHGWIQDNHSVEATLLKYFSAIRREDFDAPNAPANLRTAAWIGLFQKSQRI